MTLLLQNFSLKKREGEKKQTWSELGEVKHSKQNGAACNTQMD